MPAQQFCSSRLEFQSSVEEVSPWCLSGAKRAFDFAVALLALILLIPLMLVVAVAVKLTSTGPVLYRQSRVGKGRKQFILLKFRSMTHNRRESGPGITCEGDARVTTVGRFLRKWKLDELPQFINVLRGEMSLVGPRPDLVEFWDSLSVHDQRVLCLRPGITGCATLQYRHEESMLSNVQKENLTHHYITVVLPEKVRLDWEYAVTATFQSDFRILLQTVHAI